MFLQGVVREIFSPEKDRKLLETLKCNVGHVLVMV